MHSIITFFLRDYFTRVFYNNLVWLKATITPYPMPTVKGLDDFHANAVPASILTALPQAFEAAVRAVVTANITIRAVTFIKHKAVETVLTAAALGRADALRRFQRFGFLPYVGGVADKDV